MNKISVRICTGTLCYVMGGAELQLLDEQLPPELSDRVDIKGSPCLDCCNRGDSRAPFVMVDDVLIGEATISKIIETIKSKL